MIKRYLAIFCIGFIFAIILSSCGNEAPPAWPWWTSHDSSAVKQELARWRDTINGYHYLQGQGATPINLPLELNVPLVSTDTISHNGISIMKIAHFLGFNYILGDSTHIDDLLFEVKNDSIQTKDTFCFVTYSDSTQNCIGVFQYDSIWRIKFQIASIDTTITPWDTSWRVDSITKTGFTTPFEEQDTIQHFTIMRKLELKKDSAATIYRMKYLTGCGTYVPNSTNAPAISNVVLTKPGKSDTFYYGARQDHKGIYNPKIRDSLYKAVAGVPITVTVNTTTPTDTTTDRNYYFVSCGSPYVSTKQNITYGPKIGQGIITFTQIGINHLYIEVIPASTLFYPFAQWKSTTWSIPINVIP
jgi:hypothetical protein